MSLWRVELVVPAKIWERLRKIENKTGIKKEDLIMRALIRVIEEFER